MTNKTFILGDEMRCEFIFRNILHNAIKYSDYNQNIDIGINETNENWIIYIKDHGTGMSKERINKILAKNEIMQSANGTLNEQGAGIGLLLCNDFAKNLNWTLDITSEIGFGTTFSFFISKTDERVKQIETGFEENLNKSLHNQNI